MINKFDFIRKMTNSVGYNKKYDFDKHMKLQLMAGNYGDQDTALFSPNNENLDKTQDPQSKSCNVFNVTSHRK